MCTQQTYKKQEVLLKYFAPHNVGHVQTSILKWATAWLTIFCAFVIDNIVVVLSKCFARLHGGHVQNRFCNAPLHG